MALVKVKPTSPGRRGAGQGRQPEPAQGPAGRGADRGQEARLGPQQQRPHHHAAQGWRPQAALPPGRFPSQQGRHRGEGRAARIRPEPQRAPRAAALRRRRAPLHHRAARRGGRRAADERRGSADQAGQLPAAAQHSGRHHHPLRRDDAGQGRADRAFGRRLGAAAGARRRVRAAAHALGRNPQGARRLPRHHRHRRQRRAQPALDRQGRRAALARHPADGARHRHEPGRSPARWPFQRVAVIRYRRGARRPRVTRRAATSAPTA